MSAIANDASAHLLDQVNQALAAKTPLRIQGSGSKAFLCLLYTSPSPRDRTRSRMPSSA